MASLTSSSSDKLTAAIRVGVVTVVREKSVAPNEGGKNVLFLLKKMTTVLGIIWIL
jgi:hypothetical protein